MKTLFFWRKLTACVNEMLADLSHLMANLPALLRGSKRPRSTFQAIVLGLAQMMSMGFVPEPVAKDPKERLLKRHLDYCFCVFGDDHEYSLHAIIMLADFYQNDGQFFRARELYAQAGSIVDESQEMTPSISAAIPKLSEYYALCGSEADAVRFLSLSSNLAAQRSGRHSPEAIAEFEKLGQCLDRFGRCGEAAAIMEENIAAIERVGDLASPRLPLMFLQLEQLYNRLELTEKATLTRELANKSNLLIAMQSACGHDNPLLIPELEELSALYLRQNKKEQVARLDDRLRLLRLIKKTEGMPYPGIGDDLVELAKLYRARGLGGDATIAHHLEKKAEKMHLRARRA